MSIFEIAGLLAVAIALGAVITLAAFALYSADQAAKTTAQTVNDLTKSNAAQAVKIQELENQIRGRAHTYATANGLEDAIAVDLDLALQAARTLEYIQVRSEHLRKILGAIRSSPHAYDADRPAGRRPEV